MMAWTLSWLQASPTRLWPANVLIAASTAAPVAKQPSVETGTVVKAGEGAVTSTGLDLLELAMG